MAEEYYHLRIKKQYAAAIIEDLQQVDAVEIMEEPIVLWHQEQSLKRLEKMKNDPTSSLDEVAFFNQL